MDQLVQDRIRERYGDRITLMKTLQAQGMTFEQFRKDVRDQYIISAMRSKNVSQEIVISPYKIENYYLAHQDDFKMGDQIKLRMIVLNKSFRRRPIPASHGRGNPDANQARRFVRPDGLRLFRGLATRAGRRLGLGRTFRAPQGTGRRRLLAHSPAR